jgi:hypothetical protein
MTSGRPLLFVLLIVLSVIATSAFAADEKAQPQPAGAQNQTADPALFQGNGAVEPASDLFFLQNRPRLSFTAPAEQPRSAVLNERDCYTMRMYKVKRKERFADGESGLRGYSTCELASNYQMRTAVAHVQTAEGHDSQVVEPQK